MYSSSQSSIEHLTFEAQKGVLDKGLNSLVYLVELINFDKSVPENHSYCVTAINDKHASVIDEKTNTIVKTNKLDLFDKILGANLNNLTKISNNPKFTKKQREEYTEKINYLKINMLSNIKYNKRYQTDINLISYNNKDMIKDTWKSLKTIDNIDERPDDDNEYYEGEVRWFDDLIAEIPEDEKPDFLKNDHKNKMQNLLYRPKSSDESESESDVCVIDEIKINGTLYILEGSHVYCKTKKATKGELYGIYSNGKVKKISPKQKDIIV